MSDDFESSLRAIFLNTQAIQGATPAGVSDVGFSRRRPSLRAQVVDIRTHENTIDIYKTRTEPFAAFAAFAATNETVSCATAVGSGGASTSGTRRVDWRVNLCQDA